MMNEDMMPQEEDSRDALIKYLMKYILKDESEDKNEVGEDEGVKMPMSSPYITKIKIKLKPEEK